MERSAPGGTESGASDGSSWGRSKAGVGGSSAAAAASAASGTTAAGAAAAAMSDVHIQRAEDIGRTKWAPSKDLNSAVQGKQKLRGILNKLTPDNFDKLVVQVRSPLLVTQSRVMVLIVMTATIAKTALLNMWCSGELLADLETYKAPARSPLHNRFLRQHPSS
jgi:hypothetical protein